MFLDRCYLGNMKLKFNVVFGNKFFLEDEFNFKFLRINVCKLYFWMIDNFSV